MLKSEEDIQENTRKIIRDAITNNDVETIKKYFTKNDWKIAWIVHNKLQETVLHMAAEEEERLDCLKYLLEFTEKSELEIIDGTRWTPLITAATHANLKAMKCLIRKGANYTVTDQFGWSLSRILEFRASEEKQIKFKNFIEKYETVEKGILLEDRDTQQKTPTITTVFYRGSNKKREKNEFNNSVTSTRDFFL